MAGAERGLLLGLLCVVGACVGHYDCEDGSTCDGDTLVVCENGEASSYETRTSCTASGNSVCLPGNAPRDAFCAESAVPSDACAPGAPVCADGQPVHCYEGYLVHFPPECTGGTSCMPCDDTAVCALAVEPACTANTMSLCDGNAVVLCANAPDRDVACELSAYETPCATGATCVQGTGMGYDLFENNGSNHAYGLCALSTPADPRCAADPDEDFGQCIGDEMVECFLGYVVRELQCPAGTCDGYDQVCTKPALSTVGTHFGSP